MTINNYNKYANFLQTLSVTVIIVLSLLFLSLSSTISAQNVNKRPKVGLALSGGGAKGLAHLGVLKVMEEAGLRPDLISGVSMGSIVGGLYALGYSADTLEKIVKNIDWNLLQSDNIPENKIIYTEKHYFNNSLLSLPVTKYKILLPSGLIKGQQIESALSSLAWPAANINDFSKLPIPFMCVGTDINTCKKVDIKGGYLADAMRASMAVPSIFTPIKINDTLFVDGGLVRNFAVSEVREMGAEIVIGSYTGGNLLNEERLNSVPGIMEQIVFYSGYYDSKEQMKLLDVLIEPELRDISMLSFKYADTIIARGYKAALPYKNYFKKLADSLNMIGPQDKIENILINKSFSFDKIEITGNTIHSDDQILGVLGIKPNENVDNGLLNERIELLYGKVWFDKVKYNIISRNDSLILVIDCFEKPGIMLTGSLHYDNAINIGLILGFSGENLLTQRSKINLDLFIGQYYRIRLKYLQFIDRNQKYGISANIYADKNFLPELNLTGSINEYISHNSFYTIMLQNRLGLNYMLNISFGIDRLDLLPNRLVNPSLKRIISDFLTYSFDYSVNTLDRKHFPNKGDVSYFTAKTSLPLSITSNTGTLKTEYTRSNPGEYSFDRFYTFQVSLKHYFSVGGKLTFGLSAEGVIITDTLSNQNNFFLLGGYEPTGSRSVAMAGYNPNEIASKKFAGLGAELDLEIFSKVHLNLFANTFTAQTAGNENRFSVFSGYGLGMGYLSLIGPVKTGIMYGSRKYESHSSNIKGYFSIGFNF